MPPNARRKAFFLSSHSNLTYKRFRGRYVAAAGGELFVADTPQEVERLAREKCPDDLPHVRYTPQEKLSRIYACHR